ncbi:MAG TPA: serine protease [Verrucomicrobiae bacterium]|nr:serine protease [Verrucomicrobiae bacterium]
MSVFNHGYVTSVTSSVTRYIEKRRARVDRRRSEQKADLRLLSALGLALVIIAFLLGDSFALRRSNDELQLRSQKQSEQFTQLTSEVKSLRSRQEASAVATTGRAELSVDDRNSILDSIRSELRHDHGLVPSSVLRTWRESFLVINTEDNRKGTAYGTACHLGNGFFITVKHGVRVLGEETKEGEIPRQITKIFVDYRGKKLPARIIAEGDAPVEVHRGDWAIIKVRESINLPSLPVNLDNQSLKFADSLFRFGNDYGKGILLSQGNVGQIMANDLLSALIDGHPGVSGGGILNTAGELVGIPVGRMQADFRFSFVLPLRAEMFEKVPGVLRE